MRGILLSIKPEWWELILEGKKPWEIRKSMPKDPAPTPKKPLPVLCYISGTGEIEGWFSLPSAFVVPPDTTTAIKSRVPARKLHEYQGTGKLYAWVADKPRKFLSPMPLSAVGVDRPPMSWQYIDIPEGVI